MVKDEAKPHMLFRFPVVMVQDLQAPHGEIRFGPVEERVPLEVSVDPDGTFRLKVKDGDMA